MIVVLDSCEQKLHYANQPEVTLVAARYVEYAIECMLPLRFRFRFKFDSLFGFRFDIRLEISFRGGALVSTRSRYQAINIDSAAPSSGVPWDVSFETSNFMDVWTTLGFSGSKIIKKRIPPPYN